MEKNLYANIAACADTKVLPGLAVTIRSSLEHSSIPCRIHVLADRLSKQDKKKLSNSWKPHPMCQGVVFYDIDYQNISKFRSTMYLKSKSAYSRYFISDFLGEESKCIYLDCDLLVLRDLAELNAANMHGKTMGAVRDISVRTANPHLFIGERLQLTNPYDYFNSGVLIIDLDRWRKLDARNRLVDLTLERADTFHSQDQDALNVFFDGDTEFLDPVWNTSQYERPDTVENRIIHLIGTVKPWHARYKEKLSDPYHRTEIWDRFYDVLDRTAYAGNRPWDPAGLGVVKETIESKIPKLDMVTGKIRRTLQKFLN